MNFKTNYFFLFIFLYIIIIFLFYNQFIYIYLKPLTYFHKDNFIIHYNYNELHILNSFNYKKTITNYIPVIELNLPLYITDVFYINILLFIFCLIIIPIIIISIYIKLKNNIFIYETKEYKYKIITNIVNYIFIFMILYHIISFLLTLSLTHNNNILLFEFDIQFNIQDYIYKYAYIISLLYIITTLKLNNIYYLKYNNIYYYVIYIIILQYYDIAINLFTMIVQSFIYFIYAYLLNTISIFYLIKFYQTIVKRKI